MQDSAFGFQALAESTIPFAHLGVTEPAALRTPGPEDSSGREPRSGFQADKSIRSVSLG